MSENTDEKLDGIEIVEIPRSYIEMARPVTDSKSKSAEPEPANDSLNHFLGSLLSSQTIFGLRFQLINGNPQLLYLTQRIDNRIAVLENTFIAHFPKFSIKRVDSPISHPGIENLAVASIWGIPKPTFGSLNALARVMLSSESNSLYQAWAYPRRPSKVKRLLVKHKLQSALTKSQQQESIQSWITGTSTRTKYDIPMTAKTRRFDAEYKRLSSRALLDCHIILAFWNGLPNRFILENALAVLFGSMAEPERDLHLKSKIHTGKKALRILEDALNLQPTKKSTQMRPDESIPYFEIPRTEIGIRQGFTSSFTTAVSSIVSGKPEFEPGSIAIGYIYNNRTLDSKRVKYIPLEDLRRHLAIMGTNGSGKSSTKNRIVIDAWKNGISSLLIEPVKTDARTLLGAIDEARVFTLGLEQVAPIRLNPLHVEEGVHVSTHINLLVASFMAAWPVYGILASHLRRVIVQTYVNNGWDAVHNLRGAEITLESLWYEAERYVKTLKYGSDLRKDFRGAILARIEDLCDPARAAIFNTTADLPIEEFLSVPTIIELKHLADPDFKAFVLSLLLVRVYEHFDKLGPSDEIRNLLFIDEAHSVLEEIQKAADSNEVASARRKTADQLTDMIAESRSLGLGICILDQNALRLSRDALKVCHTKILHCNTSEADRTLLADETGCNKEQKQQMDVLRIGEVIMRGPEESVPVNVQVIYDPDTYPDMKRTWTNDDVCQRMKTFYETHPRLARIPKPPVLREEDVTEESVSNAVRVEDIITSDGFREQYLEAIENKTAQEQHLVEEIVAYYAVHITAGDPSAIEVAALIIERASDLYGPFPYTPDWTVVRQLIGNHVQHFMDRTELEN